MVFCNIFLEIFDGMVTCFLYIITFIKIKCKQIFPARFNMKKTKEKLLLIPEAGGSVQNIMNEFFSSHYPNRYPFPHTV